MNKQLKITFMGVRDKDGVPHDPDHLPREFIDAVVDMFITSMNEAPELRPGNSKKDDHKGRQ